MDRARIWPMFRDSWIVHDDADLLAIDKPVGVSSQAADPQRPDDIVSRLRVHLEAKGRDAYLGVHQRLDRDTSGLLVFTRRREVNAAVAAQFEGREVRKLYLACVQGWPKGRDRVTLRDHLATGRDGLVRVVGRGHRAGEGRGNRRPAPLRAADAKEAITHVRVVDRRADRALLSLELATGRMHQARAQLANAGAPIAGDALYGGARAPRLMLHAVALSLTHPTTKRRIEIEAPAPPELRTWLERGDLGEATYDDDQALARALDRALERRWALGRSGEYAQPRADGASRVDAAETTAFRLVNEDGDGLPRMAVDVYGGWLVAQLYGDDGPWADRARRDRVLDRLDALGFDGVYLKVRPKQSNLLVDTRRDELAPRLPVRGHEAPDELVVREEGMPLLVRLGDGLSTGVFLDQRQNRRRIRELAAGKTFANLFAYTCAFTVAAALGGAIRTVSVDVSAAALERGRANLTQAGVAPLEAHAFVAEDVFAWLARTARRGERFDLVALDPPSYSTTRRGRFVADEDYTELARAAIDVLADGGRLLACTNHRGISHDRFRRMLHDAARAAGRHAVQVKDLGAAPDFPTPPGGQPHTKSVLVTLA